jgi:hypothetical protein
LFTELRTSNRIGRKRITYLLVQAQTLSFQGTTLQPQHRILEGFFYPLHFYGERSRLQVSQKCDDLRLCECT